uniref:Uncharacterized protein n=1 Tax=Taeniopygia guttata TaxID=59729 RepID=A0A674H608_TAEGU
TFVVTAAFRSTGWFARSENSTCITSYSIFPGVMISRSSDSTSFFASSLSQLIKLKAMTSPRCWTSMLSCKQSLCRISSHWVVCKGKNISTMNMTFASFSRRKSNNHVTYGYFIF